MTQLPCVVGVVHGVQVLDWYDEAHDACDACTLQLSATVFPLSGESKLTIIQLRKQQTVLACASLAFAIPIYYLKEARVWKSRK